MAIFSQLDMQTSIDFRNYNLTKPNRTVPFKLPAHVESKLIQLMSILGQKTGSIDIIVTDEKEFVFLEVNPVGQYGMVSYPCNYELNMKMAEYLVTGMDAR
jgi:glutathione synthase/RimK-type ligase-like ATP-grasp enzyme